MDPFIDIFAPTATTNARAGGKFQPKAKHRPRKQTFALAPSMVPSDIRERTRGVSSPSSDAEQLVLPTALADDSSNIQNAFGSSSLGVNGVEESLKKHEASVSGLIEGITTNEKVSSEVGGPKEDRGSIEDFHQEGEVEKTSGVPKGGDGHSGFRAPENEVGLSGLDVDHLINSGAQPASISARVSIEQKISASAPSTLPDAIEEKLVTLPSNGLDIEASDNTRSLEVGDSSQSHATDALQSEVPVPGASGDLHSSFGKSFRENVDLFSGLEYLDDFVTQSDGTLLGDMHSADDRGGLGKGGQSRMEESHIEPNYHGRNEKSSTVSEGVEGGKLSMQLRKRSRGLVDEAVDEAYDINGSRREVPSTSNRDKDEDNDDEYRTDGSTSRKKKAPRKVKDSVPGNEKPGWKRKSAKEASKDSAKGPPKKFCHSTRRTKRRVDKALLDTPEDEIDPQRLLIKDLILLAEHRERTAIKDAVKLRTPRTNQSAENSFREDASYNEEESFVSEQDRCSDDDQAGYKVQSCSSYVNYQSFMERTPSTRWSKQETELFYEAVRQFGTVFSLIQLLFPGRTRRQVKLKFEKEERQHPMRLSEAVTNRTKDYSHFEYVIERLQQAAAQKKQESVGKESIAVAGDEEVEETADDPNDGATKSEWDNGDLKDQEADVASVHSSPSKFDESDDDPDRWSHYIY